jgi:predicted MFS family arabinose efflux permease
MTKMLGASSAQASVALAVFWAAVTAGRVGFATLGRWLADRVIYRLLPFLLVAAFLLTATLSHGDVAAGIAVFGLAGLGCSALMPLTISFGEEEFTAMSAAVAGGIIAFYPLGYGIAAFGVGPLQDAGVNLSAIFGGAAVIAAVMGVLALAVTRGKHASQQRRA